MPEESAQPKRHLSPAAVQALGVAAKALFDLGIISFEELGTVKADFRARMHGTVPDAVPKQLIDIHQLAKILCLGESTLKRLLSEDANIRHALPKVRIGANVRWRLEDAQRLVDCIEQQPNAK